MKKMTPQMESKLDERLHERLSQAREQLSEDATLPIVIKCDRDAVDDVVNRVHDIGGHVRHQLRRLGAVAAWLPLSAIELLLVIPQVRSLEMEEQYRIAS